ncbi:selenocysteine-specific translation elongation factor [candidate division KSB1 bacterium]|nr:selenocysteine-specific translation elongation factor [candidate division KSB1 bacterium]
MNEQMDQKNKRHFVIGTAGHIDHGKTALVKHLTGTDTDWLKEEKARGMTIDLGFAFLGDNITIIDVPGHEKFIRNMVAGVSTIDLVLFVVAADDGVMPQTREHLDILNLLQVKQGIIVITKIDLVDSDWLELVKDDISSLVQGTVLDEAPIFAVSNETAEGIPAVKQAILTAYESASERADKGVFRMPIDRVFSMKGFGTVVAGTVISGSLSDETSVELLPGGSLQRIRGLQIHDQMVHRVKVGDRAAVNLAGLEKDNVVRGDVIAEPGFFKSTEFLDARLYVLKSWVRAVKNTERIRVHIGTSEVIGRVTILDKEDIKPGELALVQLKLEKTVVADVDDRFVMRSYSPLDTLGGGRILDVHPRRHKRFDENIIKHLEALEKGDSGTFIDQALQSKKYIPQLLREISQAVGLPEQSTEQLLEKLYDSHRVFRYVEKGKAYYIHRSHYTELKSQIHDVLKQFHQANPALYGINKTDLRNRLPRQMPQPFFTYLLNEMEMANQLRIHDSRIAHPEHQIQIDERLQATLKKITDAFINNRFDPPSIEQLTEQIGSEISEIRVGLEILLDHRTLVRIDEKIVFHERAIEEAKQQILRFCTQNKEIRVGDVGQLLTTSRKYTVPLLNYLDQIGFTIRQGDVRIINPDI